MEFNVVEEGDVKPSLNRSSISSILEHMEKTQTVSTETIISLESQMGAGFIPNRIKNQVSSQPSKHGLSELREFVYKHTKAEEQHTILDVIRRLAANIESINSAGIDDLVATLISELDKISNLYIPNRIKEALAIDAKSPLSVNVNLFIRDSLLHKEYKTASKVIKLLGRTFNTTVNTAVIDALVSIAKSELVQDAVIQNPSPVFEGTLGEYIELLISGLNEIKTKGVDTVTHTIAEAADIEESMCATDYGWSNDMITRTYNIIRSDNMIIELCEN